MEDAQCNNCGYDLAGLPARSHCPECGQAYDTHAREGVVRPTDRTQRVERLWRRTRTILLLVSTVLMIACTGMCTVVYRFPNLKKPLIIGTLFTLVLALAAATSYLYEKDE